MTTITARTIRTLHVIDLENLASGAGRTAGEFLDAMDRYRSVVRIAGDDLVEVAVDASAWRRVAFELPRSWRVRFGYGRDGADRALLQAVDPRVVAGRFDRVVIGSGDGAFVGLAEGLTVAGRRVDVVSRAGSLSRRLARAATVVVLLPEPLDSPPPVAVAA
ncbi:MAG TPA: NYN domain-containing protein [Acidimicrobiales bacterium]|nr:NYN domain-containing protein [Acidimicrobiales bacterium]